MLRNSQRFCVFFLPHWDTSTKEFDVRSRISSAVLGARLRKAKIVQGLARVKENGRWQIWGVTSRATLSVVGLEDSIPQWLVWRCWQRGDCAVPTWRQSCRRTRAL